MSYDDSLKSVGAMKKVRSDKILIVRVRTDMVKVLEVKVLIVKILTVEVLTVKVLMVKVLMVKVLCSLLLNCDNNLLKI